MGFGLDGRHRGRSSVPRQQVWWGLRVKIAKILLGLLAFIIAVPVLYLLGQMVLLLLAFVREHHVWHQNLTVTVETPSGENTGSAVVEVRAAFGQQPLSGNEVKYAYQGEATVVEVAPGRYLFALLGGTEERFYYAAKDRFSSIHRGEWLYEIPKQTVPVELTGKHIPLLVTFEDITDPGSVRQVDPDDLDASFGCDAYNGAALPWRAAGQSFRHWAQEQSVRRAAAEASRRAGITGPAAAALEEKAVIRLRSNRSAAENARLDAFEKQINSKQYKDWRPIYEELRSDLPALEPRLEDYVTTACFRLKAVTLAVTEDPVTEGRVEGVLGWFDSYQDRQLDGDRYRSIESQFPFANELNRLDFKRILK